MCGMLNYSCIHFVSFTVQGKRHAEASEKLPKTSTILRSNTARKYWEHLLHGERMTGKEGMASTEEGNSDLPCSSLFREWNQNFDH